MSLIRPFRIITAVTDVSADWLKKQGIAGVMIDVDNTLFAPLDAPDVPIRPEFQQHLRVLSEQGIKIVLISNNMPRRVAVIAAQLELPFVAFAVKPSPFGFLRAKRKLGLRRQRIIHIGDQLLTDVIGAGLCGIKTILVNPLVDKDNIFAKPSRAFERWLGVRSDKESKLDE